MGGGGSRRLDPQAVADAPHGFHASRHRGVRLDFTSKVAHVDVDDALVAVEVVAAETVGDLGAGVGAAGVLREHEQQVVLTAPDLTHRASDADRVANPVYLQAAAV